MAVTSRSLDTRQQTMHKGGMLLFTAAVYVLALLAAVVLIGHALSVGQQWLNDIRYGMPRTVQVSGYVGHGDAHTMPTHFIAINLDGQVSVLEIPGGDIDQLTVLPGPYVVGADGPRVVPQLDLGDLDGDGHSDLLITLRGETVVYLNKDGGFRLMTPAERARLMEVEDGAH